MSKLYVVCDLGIETGRVMLGSLHQGELMVSEVRQFQNTPVHEKDALQWNIPQLFQEILEGLRVIGAGDEPPCGISCSSWAADYLLFDAEGSLMLPAYHYRDPRSEAGVKAVLGKVPWATIYEETGIQRRPTSTLFQLASETSKRVRKAHTLLPIADGFNYLLSGVPRIELSMASASQLYNPGSRGWSQLLLDAVQFPAHLLPPVVPAGTRLGPVTLELARETGLDEAQVIASCSHEIAAALAGLPFAEGEEAAFLWPGTWTLLGTELERPIVNEASRELAFTNELGHGENVCFYKQVVGQWILEECRQFWAAQDRGLDVDVLMHLAISATPFEALINPDDPRFSTTGDMPLKVQAYCKETGQEVPRKPGSVFRCVLESLALSYRKTLLELEYFTGRRMSRVLVLGGQPNNLLNYFIANALQLPVVIAPQHATTIGNVLVQAMALGHVASLAEARQIAAHSFKMQTISPHAAAWHAAFDRFAELNPAA